MNATSIETKANQSQNARDKRAKETPVKLVISGVLGLFVMV